MHDDGDVSARRTGSVERRTQAHSGSSESNRTVYGAFLKEGLDEARLADFIRAQDEAIYDALTHRHGVVRGRNVT